MSDGSYVALWIAIVNVVQTIVLALIQVWVSQHSSTNTVRRLRNGYDYTQSVRDAPRV